MDQANDREHADVLIIGAGPVGLAAAIELGSRDIKVVVVEQNARLSPQPRAKTTNIRSMEHLRRWGIAEQLRESAPLPADYPTDITFATRLFGHKLARIENAFNGARTPDDRYSEPAQWIPQYKVETVLRARAFALPSVTFHPATACETLVESAGEVCVGVRDLVTGTPRSIIASYVVGADGARSLVRKQLGISMQGQHAFGFNYNYVIRVPELRGMAGLDRSIMYWLVNPDSACFTGPMDLDDVWFFGYLAEPNAPAPTEAETKARICRAFGRDMEIEILVTDNWAAHSLVAERYGTGRVFLAGDACHLHPPFGGYGMNLGIGDGVDLGWKLAATLQGWGDASLLASYEAERRPVHQRVIEEAVANYAVLSAHLVRDGAEAQGPEGDAVRAALGQEILATKIREFKTLGVVLGNHYSGSPIVVPDGTSPPAPHFMQYQPSAHPGCLAPHLWLAPGQSLYDGFGAGFTLLDTGNAPAAAIAALLEAAQDAGMPIKLFQPQDARLEQLYGAKLALIRPDQHVAWRGDAVQAQKARQIIDILRGAAPAYATLAAD